jgi:hypothetical protein
MSTRSLARRLLRLRRQRRHDEAACVVLIDPTEHEVRAALERSRTVISIPDNHRDPKPGAHHADPNPS